MQGQAGQDADAEASRDEGEDRRVVLAVRPHVRVEARPPAGPHDDPEDGARLGVHDPGLITEIGERDATGRRLLVGRARDVQRVAKDLDGVDARRPDLAPLVVLVDDGDVDLIELQGEQALARLQVAQRESQLRVVAAERREDLWHHRPGRSGEGRHAERADDLVPCGGQLRFRGADGRRDHVGMTDEHQPGVGQADQAAMGFEQGRPRLLFQDLELLRDSGRRDRHRLCGSLECAAARDLAEELEAPRPEHRALRLQHSGGPRDEPTRVVQSTAKLGTRPRTGELDRSPWRGARPSIPRHGGV